MKAVLDVELNEGQMLEDVKLAINGAKPVDFFGHLGSQMPTHRRDQGEDYQHEGGQVNVCCF